MGQDMVRQSGRRYRLGVPLSSKLICAKPPRKRLLALACEVPCSPRSMPQRGRPSSGVSSPLSCCSTAAFSPSGSSPRGLKSISGPWARFSLSCLASAKNLVCFSASTCTASMRVSSKPRTAARFCPPRLHRRCTIAASGDEGVPSADVHSTAAPGSASACGARTYLRENSTSGRAARERAGSAATVGAAAAAAAAADAVAAAAAAARRCAASACCSRVRSASASASARWRACCSCCCCASARCRACLSCCCCASARRRACSASACCASARSSAASACANAAS